jgi:hypothetical protein
MQENSISESGAQAFFVSQPFHDKAAQKIGRSLVFEERSTAVSAPSFGHVKRPVAFTLSGY